MAGPWMVDSYSISYAEHHGLPALSGKPAASCIRSALKSACVPALANPSFTVGLTIRP